MIKLVTELLALIQAVRQETGMMNNGLFYVIERPQPVPNTSATWWDGGGLGDTPGRLPFTENIHQAIQFGSRDQAQRVLNLLHLPPSVLVSEHLWIGEARFEAELARRWAASLEAVMSFLDETIIEIDEEGVVRIPSESSHAVASQPSASGPAKDSIAVHINQAKLESALAAARRNAR